MSEGSPRSSGLGPPDSVRVAVIRIDFLQDRAGGETSGNGRFDLSGPDTTAVPIDRPPHNRDFYLAHLEALHRYYDAQSYGRVQVVGDVWPRDQDRAYSVSDLADFGPWRFSQDIYPAAVHMFRTMMFAADSQSIELGDRIPWDSYDRVLIVHAGSDFQSDLRQDSPLDIPSFTLGVADSEAVVFPDIPDTVDRPIDRVAIVPETVSQDGFFGALNGVIAHECGHLFFGFADLYNIETGFPVVGYWSLMDSGNLVGSIVQIPGGEEIFAIGLLPPSLDPFHRFFISDVVDFVEVGYGDTLVVENSQRFPDMRRMSLTSDEYLVIENRALAPATVVELDQDSISRVILGPKDPDRFEYDALLPGGGMLVWHIDASVVPFGTSFRANPGFNTEPRRLAISVVEADALQDLGDPGSPFLLGSHRDPYFLSNNPSLGDTTLPRLTTHVTSRPHMRLDFLDEPLPSMRLAAFRTWQLPGWPLTVPFPPGGPLLLAVDADGDRDLEVCWAGGPEGSADSAAIFAVRPNGQGISGSSPLMATLDARPRPLMAALPTGDLGLPGTQPQGPSYFAVSTYPVRDDTGAVVAGGQVWLLDHIGLPLPGWPPALASPVTTPPVIGGIFPNATVYVGCADGSVRALSLAGNLIATSFSAGDTITGTLAVDHGPSNTWVAAGNRSGDVLVFRRETNSLVLEPGWPQRIGSTGFEPDFLWLSFDPPSPPVGAPTLCNDRTLVVHHADRLWAFCTSGTALPGWNHSQGDTIVAGLGAGDPDGDGLVEVLTQTTSSKVAFVNASGFPSPGWPRQTNDEGFHTESPALAVDVDSDARSEVLALNAGGLLVALGPGGMHADGWPLATGTGALGAPVAADLNRDGSIEVVAPDRWLPDSLQDRGISGRFGSLYAYSIPASATQPPATSWTVRGGDPGRSSALPSDRAPAGTSLAGGPLVRGTLKVFPNPARRAPVAFAFQLSEPAEVEFNVLDGSGHRVASFTRPGQLADNHEMWDPGKVPAGLYLVQLTFRGSTGEQRETITVGLLR